VWLEGRTEVVSGKSDDDEIEIEIAIQLGTLDAPLSNLFFVASIVRL